MLRIRHTWWIAWFTAKLTLRFLGNFRVSCSILLKELLKFQPNPPQRRNPAISPPRLGLRAGNYLLPSFQHTHIHVI
jgi:hypothetical protein